MRERELQWRLIYSVIVAGKTAKFADDAMRRLFLLQLSHESCLQHVAKWITVGAGTKLVDLLKMARTGNYTKLSRCLRELVEDCPPLDTCTPQDLERIHGIGPKTSRFFILWTRPGARHAALDVHILRWLKGLGYDVPRQTPQSTAKYAKIEKWFLDEAAKRDVTPRQLDHAVWVEGADHPERNEVTHALVQARGD